MDKAKKIVIVGAGVFGLSLAYQLASEGYNNILVLDRHMPPVPDGSSNDISRVVRFDYGDEVYLQIAHEAYKRWSDNPKYKGIFFPASYVLVANDGPVDKTWIKRVQAALTKHQKPWAPLEDAMAAKKVHPVLTGELASPGFVGYHHDQAGWADAAKAIAQLRDDCIESGVSFICGRAGTVVKIKTDSSSSSSSSSKTIRSVRTLAGSTVEGDHFVLAAGAWTSSLVSTYNSTLSTGQIIGYMDLSDAEMKKYQHLPLYLNSSTGWFNLPPHEDTKTLKMAVHGWGYTRAPTGDEKALVEAVDRSVPPLRTIRERPNFVPADGEARLRQGLREILPELGDRPFSKLALCWYTDTPTGDFIMDHHPDYDNLFVVGGGSGHAFKFLPVLGEYTALAFKKSLPPHLAEKWKFQTKYQHDNEAFKGDGSRGGPQKRELDAEERAML